MAQTETLTSLAMLKVNIDHGRDYIDYLKPFVQQVLVDHRPTVVHDSGVCELLLQEFGLEIPSRTVQIVLQRFAHEKILERREGTYHATEKLTDPGINIVKSEAARHIKAVISGLTEFDQKRSALLGDESNVVVALCAFLSEFNIPCLRAYLRGTTIPSLGPGEHGNNVLISEYVLHLQEHQPERFQSFMILLQGHMLANALLCPDLVNAPRTFKGVTFYLDTPLLVALLGFEEDSKKFAMQELVMLLKRLDADILVFSHTRDELKSVLRSAAAHFEDSAGASVMIKEARRRGITKSDFLLQIDSVEQSLIDAGVSIGKTPKYTDEAHQIDELAFEKALRKEEVFYNNPRARDYDVNSVRSIYALRANLAPASIERCKAVLVTSNYSFAKAAYEFGKDYPESHEVSSVITGFALANLAWLKAPIGAPSIPKAELLAFTYAALHPTREYLNKYLSEIDKLLAKGSFTEREHQLLRSWSVEQELMRVTSGNEAALTQENIEETLNRVKEEIKHEETVKLNQETLKLEMERSSHDETRRKLMSEENGRKSLQERIFWGARNRARRKAWLVSGLISGILFVGIVGGLAITLNFHTSDKYLRGLIWLALIILAVFTTRHLFFGETVKEQHGKRFRRYLEANLKKESEATNLDFSAVL